MNKTWKPTTGDIMSIIGVLAGITLALGGNISWLVNISFATRILAMIGIPYILLVVIAIIGGIFAIKRKTWGMALAGAICAFLIPPIYSGYTGYSIYINGQGKVQVT